METRDLTELLAANSYPGRGIVLGKSGNGQAVILYFIMGRSENSRNRIFVEDGAGIRTEAHDRAKLKDPSLVIYAPVRVLGDTTIVTNGDQTDTVYESMSGGKGFQEALATRTFEPDPPILTPRISGIIGSGKNFTYQLSILKSAGGNGDSVQRFFFRYDAPVSGQGHLIHTYRCDGDPVPSFEGEPVAVAVPDDMDGFAQDVWKSLNPDNKVSLFVRYIAPETGEARTRIFNRHQYFDRAEIT